MATMTVTAVTAANTTSKTLTYSGQDAQRIFDLWTKFVWNNMMVMDTNSPSRGLVPLPPPTQQDFTDWCTKQLVDHFQSWQQRDGVVVTPATPLGIT